VSLIADPDRERSLASYRALAPGYDASCHRILDIRRAAVAALALSPGETVFDVACGTGATLPLLYEAVGPEGRVLGIEHSPEMAAIARGRLDALGARVAVAVTSVESLETELRADAMLFCYTHDVLQSRSALERLAQFAQPGCRVAVLGARFLPWSWGFAVNLFTAVRARKFLTTYRGLRKPWTSLATHCPDFRVVDAFHAGSSYLGVGRFGAARDSAPR